MSDLAVNPGASGSAPRPGSRTVGQQLMAGLQARGVDLVFGIPGVHTLELLRDLPAELRFITPRHEQGAGFMADGYARVTGRPGVCALITGPGVTNALTPLAQAYHDSVPVLVVASETAVGPGGRGHGRLHELPDQRALLGQLTGSSTSVVEPSQLGGALSKAWATLQAPRPRPAAIGVPIDVLDQPVSGPLGDGLATARALEADERDLDAAADLLAGAEQPVFVLGGGAVDAGDAALALAERLGAPIVLTGNAAGAVPDSHPLCLGVSLPFTPVLELLRDADVVLLVGTELSPVDRSYSGAGLDIRGDIVRIDVDPHELDSGPAVTVALLADAGSALGALGARVAPGPRSRARITSAEALVSRLRAQRDWSPQSVRHLPWIAALDRGLPPAERIVALDSTQLAYTALHALPVQRRRSWLAPFGLGTLGPAVPMAIGAALARPGDVVAAVVGDGGLMFTVAELATAAHLHLPLIVVVWNSGGYAEIEDSFERDGIRPVGIELELGSIQALAGGLGCVGVGARTPVELERAVRTAVDRDRPTVIEVPAVR